MLLSRPMASHFGDGALRKHYGSGGNPGAINQEYRVLRRMRDTFLLSSHLLRRVTLRSTGQAIAESPKNKICSMMAKNRGAEKRALRYAVGR
jgi:hypothetical protein